MKLSYDVLEHPTLVNKDSFLRVSLVICVNFLRSLTKTVDLRCSTKKLFCNIRKAPFFSLGFIPTRSSFTVGMNSVKYNAPFLIYFHFSAAFVDKSLSLDDFANFPICSLIKYVLSIRVFFHGY